MNLKRLFLLLGESFLASLLYGIVTASQPNREIKSPAPRLTVFFHGVTRAG